MLMMLKTIPPLVSMLDSDDPDLHIDARYALLRSTMSCNPLSFSDLRSKSYLRLQLQEQDTIMKADVVHKMLNLIKSDNFILVSEAIITNFLGLNALDSNKLIISASRVIPILLSTFRSPDRQARHCLHALQPLHCLRQPPPPRQC
ncbi:hypothetical protein OPV22_011481 [Ensete ventricosum]|uniref:Uncharacterized protein n=1 Tax=Ensete ventricosum TaxID=4639 RepID=A0AAV8RFE8_ENSVE|nr:hypothetical protein OPV22_011481 [Ensete ventricosum]